MPFQFISLLYREKDLYNIVFSTVFHCKLNIYILSYYSLEKVRG